MNTELFEALNNAETVLNALDDFDGILSDIASQIERDQLSNRAIGYKRAVVTVAALLTTNPAVRQLGVNISLIRLQEFDIFVREVQEALFSEMRKPKPAAKLLAVLQQPQPPF